MTWPLTEQSPKTCISVVFKIGETKPQRHQWLSQGHRLLTTPPSLGGRIPGRDLPRIVTAAQSVTWASMAQAVSLPTAAGVCDLPGQQAPSEC